MERQEKIRLIFGLISMVVSFNCMSQSNNTDSIIYHAKKDPFCIAKHVSFIDSNYLKFRRSRSSNFCIASLNAQFNRTDVKSDSLCDARLILTASNANRSVNIILYEEFQGGRVGNSCEIFSLDHEGVRQWVYFYVNPKINSLESLQKVLMSGKYQIFEKWKRDM